MIRIDQPDLVYRTEESKYKAVVDDIIERHEKGQPVLVGTVSVEKSEYLSDQLRRRGVTHEVLNAKHHEQEATIVADAGRKGGVTVATNMAGRGTDIMLGGNPEFRAVADLKARGLDPDETPEEYEAAWDEALAAAEADVAAEHDEVAELGGLYVLGTERHESRRIDNQLRGRSGRQGDPGESRFYLSLEDHLMRLFNAGLVDRVMTTAKLEDDQPDRVQLVSRSIQSAQAQVEAQNFEIRKNVLKYDDVLNRSAPSSTTSAAASSRARTSTSSCASSSTTSSRATSTPRPPRASPRTGTSSACGAPCGPSPHVDHADQLESATDGRARPDRREAQGGARSPTRTTPTPSARRRSARTSCARSSGGSCSRSWTASGASTSTRWTTSRRASACGRWPSATRSSSTSARASPLWNTMNEAVKEESFGLLFHVDVRVDAPEPAAPAVGADALSADLGAMAGAAARDRRGQGPRRHRPRAGGAPRRRTAGGASGRRRGSPGRRVRR